MVICYSLNLFAMEFLKEYGNSDSDTTDTENSTDAGGKASNTGASEIVMNARAVRQVYRIIDQRETDMMSVRWKIFHFNVQIQQDVQKEIPKCSKCFATFVLR